MSICVGAGVGTVGNGGGCIGMISSGSIVIEVAGVGAGPFGFAFAEGRGPCNVAGDAGRRTPVDIPPTCGIPGS